MKTEVTAISGLELAKYYLLRGNVLHLLHVANVSRQNRALSPRSFELHNHLALLDHCTHVIDLGHDLQDHVQLRILKKSEMQQRNKVQIIRVISCKEFLKYIIILGTFFDKL